MSSPNREIAERFLPDRYLYWYVRGKLTMDPLYRIVCDSLREDRAPLLDVGCGVGLLLHCRRGEGQSAAYIGVDNDDRKLAQARMAAERLPQASDVEFRSVDLNVDLPPHRGSVALLDVLQYLEPQAQLALLERAAQRVAPQGVLVLRGGLEDGGWRAALTRTADRFGHAVRWMRSSFRRQPRAADLEGVLADCGLQAQFRPAWGRTPFNNWLITARRTSGDIPR